MTGERVALPRRWIAATGAVLLLGCSSESGGAGGAASGGAAGSAQGGSAQGGSAQGGNAQGGSAQGGNAQGGSAQGGSAQGGAAGAGGSAGVGGGLSWSPQAWEDCEQTGRALSADPSNYRSVVDGLVAGDILTLAPGDYDRGLPIRTAGAPGSCVVIQGADAKTTRILGSDAFNLVALYGASYVKVRDLTLVGEGRAGFGVASQGPDVVHHIVLENLDLSGFDADQQIVGISSKTPAHHWVIRGNRVHGAGTGLYLGNSDGSYPFYAGVIEFNSVTETLGYSMQIKHQTDRPGDVPDGADTLIRHNVFSKGSDSSTGGNARPNLLLGHQPTSGVGSTDRFVVYANFFYDNPTEMLFQAEGNLLVSSNLFVNPSGGAVAIQPHNAVPRQVDFVFNTILASSSGVRISGGDAAFSQRAVGNVAFAAQPYAVADARDNVEGALADAASAFVAAGSLGLPGLDLHPQAGALRGAAIDVSDLPSGEAVQQLDFDGQQRDHTVRGAYAGSAPVGAWPLGLSAPSYASAGAEAGARVGAPAQAASGGWRLRRGERFGAAP